MINYKNFLIRVNEGLIKTHDLNKSINIIEREMVNSPSYKIDVDYNNNAFSVFFGSIPSIQFLDYWFDIINNLGYYPTIFKVWNKKNMSNIFNIPTDSNEESMEIKLNNLIKNKKYVEFFFDAKYDKVLKIPNKLYHTTTLRKKSKILKYGLSPKSNNRKNVHPERIYFDISLNNSYDTAKSLRKNDLFNKNEKLDYCIIEINTMDIIKLYKDPHSKGCYTYDNIDPKNIIDLNIVV